jgi:hypothetical protein
MAPSLSSEINDLQELLMGELVPPPQGSWSYPCELTKDGWVHAASGKPMMVRATYWTLQVERHLSSLATDLAMAICHGSAPRKFAWDAAQLGPELRVFAEQEPPSGTPVAPFAEATAGAIERKRTLPLWYPPPDDCGQLRSARRQPP